MTPAPVPAPSRPALAGWLPLLGGLLWVGGAVAAPRCGHSRFDRGKLAPSA